MEECTLNSYNLPKEVSSDHVRTQTLVRFNWRIVQV